MIEVDFLLVGQGLAGSVLASNILQNNRSLAVVDLGFGESASRQATGLINPITGRRFVKSWKIDEIFPFAQKYYEELEVLLETKFYKRTSLIKVLNNIEQQNDFAVKCLEEEYKNYLAQDIIKFDEQFQNPFACVKIEPVLQIDVNLLLEAFHAYLKKKASFLAENFNHELLQIKDHCFVYKNFQAKHLIFAEGFYIANNPFFNYLPHKFAKGEAVIFKSAQLKLSSVLGSHINICPLGNDLYYAGASYNWSDNSLESTEEKKAWLIEKLDESIKCTYEVLAFKVGVRPTVIDRRPLIGAHPQHPNMFVFNGMGTKGLSLAPYFGKELIDHILRGNAIDPEVSINRFL
jgi:glycine oxidase